MTANRIELSAIHGMPVVRPGDDLGALIGAAMPGNHLTPQHGDIFVVAQKVVSKAENRFVDLSSLVPSPRAHHLPAHTPEGSGSG